MADLFLPGLVSQEDVEALYLAAIADLSATEVISQWSSEGTSVTKTFPMDAKYIADECIKFLRKVDPAKYGRAIRTTKGYFI